MALKRPGKKNTAAKKFKYVRVERAAAKARSSKKTISREKEIEGPPRFALRQNAQGRLET
jgi:hypothetical protein